MSLPDRLNELAVAHDQGLVNDDEYRLLRQSLFEQYVAEPTPRHQPHHPHPQPQSQPQPQSPPPPPPLRRKRSVVSGVANLLRRATGRPVKKHSTPGTPDPPVSPDRPSTPRRFLRNTSLLSLHLGDSPHQQQQQQQQQSDQDDPAMLRAAIAATNAEHSRLLSAFHSLESSALKRIQYKTAHRLYTPTPTNVNVLIEGREWRQHTRPVPSIVLPLPANQPNPRRHQHPLSLSSSSSATGTTSDHLSINSAASSSRTSLSLSRSVSASLPRNFNANMSLQPQPPLSPRLRTLHRQNSLSSTHSSGTNSRSAALAARSTGNLQLSSLAEQSSTDTIADSRINEDIGDDDPEAADYGAALTELNDIRQKRDELNARYVSRLEYLRARLKAAELHEKVMRR